MADYAAVVWFGIVAPKGTPAAVTATINSAVNAILAVPAISARLEQLGYTAAPGTPEELARYMQEETLRWRKAVQVSGAKAE